MRPSLTINEFLNNYQQKLKPSFSSRQIGLDREIKLSRQAADNFDAADYFNVIRTRGAPDSGTAVGAHRFRVARQYVLSAVARARLLQISGYNSAQDIISRQNQAIARDEQAASQ